MPTSPPSPAHSLQPALRSRSRCAKNGDGDGSYVRTRRSPIPAPRFYPYRGAEWTYEYHDCAFRDYVTDRQATKDCVLHSERQQGRGAVRRDKVLLTGDSQIRTLFRAWESVAADAPPILLKGGNLTLRDSGSDVTYLWDPYLDAFAERGDYMLHNFDAVVLGMGPWPCSFGQWTMTHFEMRVRNLTHAVRRLVAHGVRVVWAGAPAWPKPRAMPRFRITNYRLGVMNAIGASLLGRAGAKHLNWFQIALPFLKLHRGDGMHFDWSVVIYTAHSVLRTILCAAPRFKKSALPQQPDVLRV